MAPFTGNVFGFCFFCISRCKSLREESPGGSLQEHVVNTTLQSSDRQSPIAPNPQTPSTFTNMHSSTLWGQLVNSTWGEILSSQYTGPIHSPFNPLCALCLIWPWLLIRVVKSDWVSDAGYRRLLINTGLLHYVCSRSLCVDSVRQVSFNKHATKVVLFDVQVFDGPPDPEIRLRMCWFARYILHIHMLNKVRYSTWVNAPFSYIYLYIFF